MLVRPFIFKINDGSGPTLLLQVFLERGWKEYNEDMPVKDFWNIWWKNNGFPVSQWKHLKGWQFTNHVPKGSLICRKDYLSRYLKHMKKTFGGIYDFSPAAYNLPLDYCKLVETCSKGPYGSDVWICKPVGQSQGRGISLFRKVSDLAYCTSSVVQRYIQNPLLIGGYKFDLRLYVCVPCFHPLTIYAYREGLARFSTVKFSLSDLSNRYAHLTNSSLNKQGPGYLEMKERVGAGCKWSLKKLRYYLDQNYLDDWLIWQRIVTMIILTIASQLAGIPKTRNCFEFYGFDILIDSALKPWLLEVNQSPALCTDCDVDPAVKKPMLHDLFDLLGLPVCNTGLSLFSDWGNTINYCVRPEEDEENYNYLRKSRMAVKAVNVVAMANKWKRQLKPPQSAKVGQVKDLLGDNPKPRSGFPSKRGSSSLTYEEKEICRGKTNFIQKEKDRREWPKCKWDNGRDWREPPKREGDWVRLYPFCRKTIQEEEDGQLCFGDKEIRQIVPNVIRYYKTAREVFAKGVKFSDEERDSSLLDYQGLSDTVWHPYK